MQTPLGLRSNISYIFYCTTAPGNVTCLHIYFIKYWDWHFIQIYPICLSIIAWQYILLYKREMRENNREMRGKSSHWNVHPAKLQIQWCSPPTTIQEFAPVKNTFIFRFLPVSVETGSGKHKKQPVRYITRVKSCQKFRERCLEEDSSFSWWLKRWRWSIAPLLCQDERWTRRHHLTLLWPQCNFV